MNFFFFKLLFFTYINFFLNFFSCFLLRKQQVICLRLSPSLAPTHNIYKSLLCYPHSCFSFSLTASECAFPLCQQLQSFHRRWWLVASAITCNINFFFGSRLTAVTKADRGFAFILNVIYTHTGFYFVGRGWRFPAFS